MLDKIKFKINAFFYGLPNIPNEIVIELTDRCNLNCSFCFNKLYTQPGSRGGGLDTALVKTIIDKIKRAKVPIVRFTGGEPLLRNDTFELMDYASQQGLRVWLNTNATLIDRKIAVKIARYVENVLIPLNAHNSEFERTLTGENAFKRKLKGAVLLKESGIQYLRCGTVATRCNIANLEKIYSLVKRLKIIDWELFRVIPSSHEEIPVDNNDIALLVEKLISINAKENTNYKIANALPFCAYDPEKIKKVALGAHFDDGHTRFVVNVKGDAVPMYYISEKIGNILRDDVLPIWNNRFMKNMRLLHYVPNVCKRCKYIRTCKGGSRATAKIVKGQYDEIDYLAQPYRAY